MFSMIVSQGNYLQVAFITFWMIPFTVLFILIKFFLYLCIYESFICENNYELKNTCCKCGVFNLHYTLQFLFMFFSGA